MKMAFEKIKLNISKMTFEDLIAKLKEKRDLSEEALNQMNSASMS